MSHSGHGSKMAATLRFSGLSAPHTSTNSPCSAQPGDPYGFRIDLFLSLGSFSPGPSSLSEHLWQHRVQTVEDYPLLAAVLPAELSINTGMITDHTPSHIQLSHNLIIKKGSHRVHWIFQAKHNIKPPITAANSHFSIAFVSCHKFYLLVTSCILFQGFLSILGITYWD